MEFVDGLYKRVGPRMSICAVMKAGKQKVLQPPFAPSDQKFNTPANISMVGIASDRSGNERAVKICKSLSQPQCAGIKQSVPYLKRCTVT
jgi:hypothetical protein